MDQNKITDLVELFLRVAGQGEDGAEVRVDLRIASADIDAEDGTMSFSVSLKKAWLSMDVNGVTPEPGTRHGEPKKENEVQLKSKVSTEDRTEVGVQAGVNVCASPTKADASLNLGAKAAKGSKELVATSSAETTTHMRVKARGGLSWEIAEARPQPLDGTYLENEVLCRVTALPGANSKSIELLAYAKQKDLILDLKSGGSKIPFKSNNHEKMLKILIAKALSATGSRYAGKIDFSKSEAEIEGREQAE